MSNLAIYPGTFDPVTNGHLDIITRALAIFDKVVVAVAQNISKKSLFNPEERAALLRESMPNEARIEVEVFSGLLVNYVLQRHASIVVRGLRAAADFEFEFQLALMNRRLAPEVTMIFLMTDERNLYISSSLVKEVALLGGDVSDFVPSPVVKALKQKLHI